MAKRRDEMDSAMGPSGEPGEAQPAPAEESSGLGGIGTEGKPGNPEGGTEPQIPAEAGISADVTDEELRQAAERLRRDLEKEKTLNPAPPPDTNLD